MSNWRIEMYVCNKCQAWGLSFKGDYKPEQFLEGKTSSKVWIVGLNPHSEVDTYADKTPEDLANFICKGESYLEADYFQKIKAVSEKLHRMIGKENGCASTDIVKCFSMTWPPRKEELPNISRFSKGKVEETCGEYLRNQIKLLKPLILVCNGESACRALQKLVKPTEKKLFPIGEWMTTYYVGEVEEHQVVVILAGFWGRVDNRAKRRIGLEIEWHMQRLELG